MEDIKDKVRAIFKAHNKAAEDKIDEVNKAKLPKLLAEKVAKIGLLAVPTT
jgi:hypothetical protein